MPLPNNNCCDHRSEASKCASGGNPLLPTDVTRPKRSPRVKRLAPIFALLFPLFFSACTMQTETFDSDTWKAQRGVSARDNKRIDMVPTLEANVRAGMTRTEVIGLLGEPDSRNSETDTDRYFLGLPLGPDEQYYEIRYLNGVVSSLRLGQF
jgi:hypothetical protein